MNFIVIFLYLSATLLSPSQQSFKKDYQEIYKDQRKSMVETQIKSRGITDKNILDAFFSVERHEFIPTKYREYAYFDHPLPIGEGQTISQPYIVAFMTEQLKLSPKDKVLEIGTGSGYQAAILAELGIETYSIEIIKSLAQTAKSTLEKIGYKNIHLKTGDGYKGWPEFAPFDAIIVTCAPSAIPEPLKAQLAEGGRMIIPVGKQGTVQKLILLQKHKGKIKQKSILPVRFVPMIDSLKVAY